MFKALTYLDSTLLQCAHKQKRNSVGVGMNDWSFCTGWKCQEFEESWLFSCEIVSKIWAGLYYKQFDDLSTHNENRLLMKQFQMSSVYCHSR